MVCSETVYIESATTKIARLARIEQIIEALELKMVETTGTSNIEEYDINDGQTKIKTKYVTAESMSKAIEAYERIANKLRNQLNGRQMALRDARGLC
jgi:hypothetical protein